MPPPNARRQFFRLLAGDACAFVDEARGIPQLRLDDLPKLPDDKLGLVIPVVADGVRLSYTDGFVVAARPDRPAPLRLFPSVAAEVRVLTHFRGDRPLAAIADDLAGPAADGPTRAAAFARVRACFLRLVAVGVCVPANPVS